MRFFWRLLFPPLYGLLIYTTIRLVNDTTANERFWERSWWINAGEILVSIGLGYVFDLLLRNFMRRMERKDAHLNFLQITREFSWLVLLSLLITNPVVIVINVLTDDGVHLNDLVISNIVVILYVLLYYAIARGNRFLQAYIDQRLQLEKSRSEQLLTELKFLKAQYHPHFLFNALNTIYFQMDEDVGAAKKSIEKFSELLRYQLYDQQQQVPIHQELDYLQAFIALQRTRSSDKLRLELEIGEGLSDQLIYPLLLLPLVENAFKYVGGTYHIHITAQANEGGFRFAVDNSVPPEYFPSRMKGIGLENLQRRLELLYPGKHEFNIHRSQSDFRTEMKLVL